MSIYVGSGRINYPAMRGPCPYGFHVPSYNDFVNLHNIGVSLGAWGSGGAGENVLLKIPLAGYRDAGNSSIYSQGGDGIYRCSNAYSNQARRMGYSSGGIVLNYITFRGSGLSIRPFKDVPEIPTSSWTKLYGTSVESGGIFWNSSTGLISLSSNGQDWITIADKNLGATTVWNSGDTLSEANCGKYFQRGNNYPFSRTGSVTSSTTKVDASNYGPGNWYYNSTFIKGGSSPYDRSSVQNDNLRGGVVGAVKADVKDICVGAGVDDYSPMQGPCPDGFHIPTGTELVGLYNMGESAGAWVSGEGTKLAQYLKLPRPGYISGSNGTKYNSGSTGYYMTYLSGSYCASSSSRMLNQSSFSNGVCGGISVRPFKNEPVEADSTWTVIYQGTNGKGIFWNKGLGLISIYDGSKWVTIADKNLGAKKVWNSGDTLNEDNCGYYYQFGNNYGFPYSGPASTSTSQVDVSNYGPSYPYYSTTFVKRSSDPYKWGYSNIYLPGQTASTFEALRGHQIGIQKKGNVKQVYVGTTPARPTYKPGIYWNKSLKLISISADGKNRYTISDRNAGAKIVYNAGDTLNKDNAGNHYQWGNNYPFPYTGSLTTSTTRVSTTSYSRKNPYRGSTFIKTNASPYDRSLTQNRDLWGQTTNTLDARRGPCDNGFHVPTNTELNGLKTAMTGLGITTGGDRSKYLKIPMTGIRNNAAHIDLSGYFIIGSSSFGSSTSLSQISCLRGNSSGDVISIGDYAGDGLAIRPFKNEPVVPDNSRAVLYQPS